MRRGLTLIELIMTASMMVVLVGAMTYVFLVVLTGWSTQLDRAGIDIQIDRGIEEMARDLREAEVVQSANDEIRFTEDQVTYYIYYLYNEDDSYPLRFDQSSYELREATLSGGIGGTFTYGSGRIIIIGVLPPPTSDLSLTNNMITIDLSINKDDETVRSRTSVKPRNL